MSGICGIVALDGRPVEPGEIEALLAPLRRRGPDGSHAWRKGPVALGHTLLATTPEALVEMLPRTHPETGCTITADVRLDNRKELAIQMGLLNEQRVIGDGELILLAYLKWGETCLDHLLGDFAFAIWDPREQKLFCARDQVGMRQLIYHHVAGSLFAFATEPRAILHHPLAPYQINEGRIADYLEDLEAYDLTSTFFQGIHRLPPAHALALSGGSIRIRRYWELKPQPELRLPDDEAYAAAFLEVFTEAVRARLRSFGPVGSMLSGGMDSGSVSAVAARLLKQAGEPPLATFSAIGTDAACVETRALKAALSMDHIDPICVSITDLPAYRHDLEQLLEESGEPFDGHMTLPRVVYLAAHRAGLKVVLDGVGGDTTLGSDHMVVRYIRCGQFRRAWREAKGEERFWGASWPAWKTFLVASGQVLVPKFLRTIRRAVLRPWQDWQKNRASLVAPDFADRIDMARRRREDAAATPVIARGANAGRPKRMLHPYLIVGRERYDRVAAALAIEPRDPFLDRRVLQFCLSLPLEQLQADGWPKVVLRRAMAGRLPDVVRWRVGKEHLGWTFTQSLFERECSDLSLRAVSILQSYVRERTLNAMLCRKQGKAALALSIKILHLRFWLVRRLDPLLGTSNDESFNDPLAQEIELYASPAGPVW